MAKQKHLIYHADGYIEFLAIEDAKYSIATENNHKVAELAEGGSGVIIRFFDLKGKIYKTLNLDFAELNWINSLRKKLEGEGDPRFFELKEGVK